MWIVIPLAGLVAVIAWLIVSGEPDVEHTGIPGWFGRSASSLRRLSSLAQKFERTYGMAVDPETQLCVTCGSTEAMMSAALAVIDPGDEVVVFEPFYDRRTVFIAFGNLGLRDRALTLATGRRETSP